LIPFEFQYLLGVEYAVGRLYFETADDYERYARSTVAYETAKSVPNHKEITYWATRHPGDPATDLSASQLIGPLAEGIPSAAGINKQPIHKQVGYSRRLILSNDAIKENLLATLLCHLFDLLEPKDVVPAWKRWSPILLRPEGLYDTCPAAGGNKAAKLKATREALRTAKRVWLATDCDREGQLIGQEILEHYKFRGQVMRVLFTAQDSQTIRMHLAAQSQMPNMPAFTPLP
jgi:Toprim domain